MHRMTLIAVAAAVVVAAGLPPLTLSEARAEDRFAGVEVRTVRVKDGVYALFGQGGNIGVSVGEDGILMIDDQFLPLADKIKAALAELGSASPTYLLNTHYHGDHTGGNAAFGGQSTIVAHENVRVRLVNGDTPGDYPDAALPVITYSDEASLYFNGEEIRLTHMPAGHTDGDTVVHFTGTDVVHMGDDFFKDRFPFVDLEAGGSVQGMIRNVEAVLNTISDSTRIIPGHGELAGKADLARYHEMLIETSSTVRDAITAGKSVDEIVAQGLGEKWSSWGAGFINEERWIRTIHASYSP